jgi:hypothetical protein
MASRREKYSRVSDLPRLLPASTVGPVLLTATQPGPSDDYALDTLHLEVYPPGSVPRCLPTSVFCLVSCKIEKEPRPCTIFRFYSASGTDYSKPSPKLDLGITSAILTSAIDCRATCNSLVYLAQMTEDKEAKNQQSKGNDKTLIASTKVASIVRQAYFGSEGNPKNPRHVHFYSVYPDFMTRINNNHSAPSDHADSLANQTEFHRTNRRNYGEEYLPRFADPEFKRPQTRRDVVVQNPATDENPEGTRVLIQQGTNNPPTKVHEYLGSAQIEGPTSWAQSIQPGPRPPSTNRVDTRKRSQDAAFGLGFRLIQPPWSVGSPEEPQRTSRGSDDSQVPSQQRVTGGGHSFRDLPADVLAQAHSTLPVASVAPSFLDSNTLTDHSRVLGTGPQSHFMPFQDGEGTPLFFTESPPSFDPSYDGTLDRAQEGQLKQQTYDPMSYQHRITAPNTAQGQLRQTEVAYPDAVYPLNNDDLHHRPQSLIEPNVQYGAYASLSAQPINHMDGGEARLPPAMGFNDGSNAVEGNYSSPFYGASAMSQSFKGYITPYSQPNSLTSRPSNPANTLPATSYSRSIKAEATPFRQPVNSGTPSIPPSSPGELTPLPTYQERIPSDPKSL